MNNTLKMLILSFKTLGDEMKIKITKMNAKSGRMKIFDSIGQTHKGLHPNPILYIYIYIYTNIVYP